MYGDILVPSDGSDAVDATLEHALAIGEPHGATIHALSVVDRRILSAAATDSRDNLAASLEREASAAVEAVTERAAAAGLETTTAVREGTPSREIIEYATESGIDLIAIGSHGKSPREKIQTMGSVSERVVDGASVPVLVVRSDG